MEEAAEEMEPLAEPHPLQAVLLSLWWVLPTPELVFAAALECPCTYITACFTVLLGQGLQCCGELLWSIRSSFALGRESQVRLFIKGKANLRQSIPRVPARLGPLFTSMGSQSTIWLWEPVLPWLPLAYLSHPDCFCSGLAVTQNSCSWQRSVF